MGNIYIYINPIYSSIYIFLYMGLIYINILHPINITIYDNMGNIHQYSSHYIPMFVAVPVRQSLINHPPFEVKSRGTSGYEARFARSMEVF